MRPLILSLLFAIAGCHQLPAQTASVIAARCGACHIVPGVPGATGRVGPSLAGIGRQQILAGHFPNSRENLVRWIRTPQAMLPGNAMPDTGLSPAEADAVADYLYTLDQ
jgi:cytochrome c2